MGYPLKVGPDEALLKEESHTCFQGGWALRWSPDYGRRLGCIAISKTSIHLQQGNNQQNTGIALTSDSIQESHCYPMPYLPIPYEHSS
eukprot:scaffold6955_cov145-Alexandrium_tamarense.AAC.1